ncbi:hypothetical protein WJX73_006588 [Symbiochloris irregularis]|uniref:Uncharacterized protein n=1 Tax=Symbiochloris irregularis TaxID=706552 RepID=A0AAW1NW44_9CHLO
MTALVGPANCGKHLLLDVLAGRTREGRLTGAVLYAGKPVTAELLQRCVGFVGADDSLLGTLTVFEMLMYTAELKLPQEHSYEYKKGCVDGLVQQLGLGPCGDTVIAAHQQHKGLTGSQVKLVSIAIALLGRPRVLFLDEPVTGLDSYASQEKVMLMLRGRVIYFGNNGQQVVDYFEGCFPDVQPLGEDNTGNEAEWLTSIACTADREKQAARFADTYAASALKQDNDSTPFEVAEQAGRAPRTQSAAELTPSTTNRWWWTYLVLTKYHIIGSYRHPPFIAARVAYKIVTVLLLFLLFWAKGNNIETTNLPNIVALHFILALLPAFASCVYIPNFIQERQQHLREHKDGYYHSIVYLCAKMTEEVVIATFLSIIFCLLIFYPLQLMGNWACFWLVYLTTMCTSMSMAYALSGLADSIGTAQKLVGAYVTITLTMFAGYLLRIPAIPNYAQWYTYLTFTRYAFGALLMNEYNSTDPDYIAGNTVLQYYGLEGFSRWEYWSFEGSFAVSEFPSLDEIISVETVSVVKNVIAADQLKQALDFLYTAVGDLQRPERFCTPENLEGLRAELQAEIAAVRHERLAQDEASAAQQEALHAQIQELTEQQKATNDQVQELKTMAEELQAKTSGLIEDVEVSAKGLEEAQQALDNQRQQLDTVVAGAIESGIAKNQELAAQVDAVKREVMVACKEATDGVTSLGQRMKEDKEEAALQKVADMQRTDDIINTRMASSNVDGLSRAVSALSREAARTDGAVQELQAAHQELMHRLGSKAGIRELQAVAQARTSEGGGVEGDPNLALLHERVSSKGDATDLVVLQRELAQVKRAVGPGLLAQQQQSDNITPGAVPSLQDVTDKLMERLRRLESTLGAQTVVSRIMRRSLTDKGLGGVPVDGSLLDPASAEEAAAVGAASALGAATDADMQVLRLQIKALRNRLGINEGEVSALKLLTAGLQNQLEHKVDSGELTKLRLASALITAGGDLPEGEAGAAGGAEQGEAQPVVLSAGANVLIKTVSDMLGDLATRQDLGVLQTRVDGKIDTFVVNSLREDVLELQEEVDASKRAFQATGGSTLNTLASGVMAPANTGAGNGSTAAPGAVASPQAHLLDYVVDVLGRGNPELASLTSMTQAQLQAQAQAQGQAQGQGQGQGVAPSVQDLAAHQQILAQQVQRLAVELSKRRSSRKSDGDHALLSRKPALTGYTCMACDRPLDKLAAYTLPGMPTKRMPAQIQMEYIPAHGVVSADGTELKTHRDSGTRRASSPGRVKQRDYLTPGIEQPREDVGPSLPGGGWKSTQQHPTSRPGTAVGVRPTTGPASPRKRK